MRRVGRLTMSVYSPTDRGPRPRLPSGPVDKTLSTRLWGAVRQKKFHIVRWRPPRVAVLFGTLGWRPQSLVPSIRSTESLERLVFYHSDHAKSRDARAKVMEFCRSLGVPATGVELSDAFDLFACAGQIREDVRRERASSPDLRFSIAGGTRLMTCAALLVCLLEGIPATYVHAETSRQLTLPLIRTLS